MSGIIYIYIIPIKQKEIKILIRFTIDIPVNHNIFVLNLLVVLNSFYFIPMKDVRLYYIV